MNWKIILTEVFFVALGLSTCGCGSGRPETAPVHGQVTYQGKPVVEGTIIFYPQKGRPATASLAPDGTYRLTTFKPNDGATLGCYRVTIEARRITPTIVPPDGDPESVGTYGPPKIVWLLPEKYSGLQSSSLTAEVKRGDNTFNFILP